ncbi:LL-diaminopimelate aminotransferase [Prochlorothrix hollandica]|uniref:Succinyldiaminopimelate aminotransferase n=1 Tax=Prochlorothrix hollandica PCC 9006 = CALU 1027 TaxID=317619 RepID=A0A0M2PY60_PROHO|nr:LL-diaminopimelate aminotransferase [Prochlorothrix hollandica]KKJ01110.1 succinyldiaminopimelate aminotransferase [Prochlorothrix hollandica PCC 9006 = CALU 1027]
MEFARRLQPLQRNVFADMDRAKAQAIAAGTPILDLSLGSSDLSPPPEVLAAIAAAVADPRTHGYGLHHSTLPFREAAAAWYTRKFGVAVDPATEVLLLIGSQEGTGHLPLALLNPGDVALLCDPCYPSHRGGIYLAGGEIYGMPLAPDHGFLPQFGDIPGSVLDRAKCMVLSYPHNPTTALAPLAFFEEAVAFCQRHDLVLIHDFPYPDFSFAPDPVPSVLQADPGKTCSIELFSLSKSFHMGGFRVGYAIGNRAIIEALGQVKGAIDFNQYQGILRGAIVALTGDQRSVVAMAQIFRERRDRGVAHLQALGWTVPLPPATPYVWAPLPTPWHRNSMAFCTQLAASTGVVLAPGIGFGPAGEGYGRFALVHDLPLLTTALDRIGTFLATQSPPK